MGTLIVLLTICFLLLCLFLFMWLSEVKEHRGARAELELTIIANRNERTAAQSEISTLRKANDDLQSNLELLKVALQVAAKRLEKFDAKEQPIKAKSWHQIRVLNDAENKRTELEEINKNENTDSRLS